MSLEKAVLEQRREVRVPASVERAWLMHAPNQQEPITLDNVSARGAKITGLRRAMRPYSEYVLMLEDTPFRVRCCWSRPARYQNGFAAGCVVVDADHGRPWSQSWADFLNRHGKADVIHTRQRRSAIRIVRPYRIVFRIEERLYVGWTRNFCLQGASLALPREVPETGVGSLQIRLHAERITIDKAHVIRCAAENDGSWSVAVRFETLPAAQEASLIRLIARLKQDWADGSTD